MATGSTGSSLIGGAEDISKGLFGYRKTDVEQLLSDRDHMLRQAESRIRSAEARIGELEQALDQSESQKAAMQEQLRQHQRQLQGLNAQRAQVENYAAQVRAQAEKIAAWQNHVQGMVGSMAPTVDRLLLLVDGAPSRVQEALSPVATKMPALVNLMRDFVQLHQARQAPASR
jgi:predicted  nucleic acid-binding Zn-ribbon protein